MFSIDEYKEAVRFLSTQKIDFVIQNEGDEHAKVIFTNMFRTAEHHIRLAANTLRNPVVDSREYQDALDIFLGKGDTQLDIIINHIPESISQQSSDNIYQRLRHNPAYGQGRIRIKTANGNHFYLGDNQDKPINFCVADGRMYRIENDIEKRTAFVNFNDPDKSDELGNVFDNTFNKLQESVDLTQYFE